MKTASHKFGLWAAGAASFLVILAAAMPSSLLDLYKTGRVVLKPDPSFGQAIDWDNFFFDDRQEIAVAHDGSIFVASIEECSIFKFDAAGRLVKKFGQKGQGPGDFNLPLDVAVLDGRLLVVGEYATNCRISLFNLDGTFHKLLKTKHPTSSVTALRDNKIAYVSWLFAAAGATTPKKTLLVLIADAATETEKEVLRWTTGDDFIQVGPILITPQEKPGGDILIARSARGNLLVGNTTVARIDEYSPDGQHLGSFDLRLTPIPVTKAYIQNYKRLMVKDMKSRRDYQAEPRYRDTVDKFESASIGHIFGNDLPLYKEILVDEEGNILVFKKSDCLENCPHIFQVYAPDGKFVCETELASADLDISVDPRARKICFTDRGIFCLFPRRGDELQAPRLIKVDLAAAAGDRTSRD